MADETGLIGLNPYDLQDIECRRLADHFSALSNDDWGLASGCEGWSRHDVLSHLVAIEQYFSACLSFGVKALIQQHLDSGSRSLDDFNAAGVSAGSAIASNDLLAGWRSHNEENRAGFRAADGTDIDTSVGAYPARFQAFHAAFEYAIHANDVAAAVSPEELDTRQNWLAGVARFALTEIKPTAVIEEVGGRYEVTTDHGSAAFDRDTFVSGVAGRAKPDAASQADLELLSLGY